MALDVVIKTDKTPLLGRILSKYVGRLTSCIENETTKIRNHSRQNDTIGLNRLLGNLKTVHNPEIILKAINVYSRRLQVFSQIMRFNPLEAKKQLNSLHVRKSDKIETETLAQSQFVLNRKPTHVQEEV